MTGIEFLDHTSAAYVTAAYVEGDPASEAFVRIMLFCVLGSPYRNAIYAHNHYKERNQ